MSKDDEMCLLLGRMVARLIRDVRAAAAGEHAYARNAVTFPGGAVEVLVASDAETADALERGAAEAFDCYNVTPRSRAN